MDFLKTLGIKEKNFGCSTGLKWNNTTDQGELKIHSPATGELIATVYQASAEDYENTIKVASEAFKYWSRACLYSFFAKDMSPVPRYMYATLYISPSFSKILKLFS